MSTESSNKHKGTNTWHYAAVEDRIGDWTIRQVYPLQTSEGDDLEYGYTANSIAARGETKQGLINELKRQLKSAKKGVAYSETAEDTLVIYAEERGMSMMQANMDALQNIENKLNDLTVMGKMTQDTRSELYALVSIAARAVAYMREPKG